MTTRYLVVAAICLGFGACATPAGAGQHSTGALPQSAQLDIRGRFTLSPDGTLHLALAKPCGTAVSQRPDPRFEGQIILCDRRRLDAIKVVARTPWQQEVQGTWKDPAHLVFMIDWKIGGFDPLGERGEALASAEWNVSGAKWRPTSAEATEILRLVGDATGTETTLVAGGPPPSLEATVQIDGGTLRVGDAGTLTAQITNRGSGTAYRVVATLRSSIEGVQGQRLSFGAIKPGASKQRQLKIAVPPGEASPDTMLVLVVTEGNGAATPNVSRRVPIAPSTATPVLAARCAIAGHPAPRPDLEAGQRFRLRCEVDNRGDAEAKAVELEASIGGGPPIRTRTQPITAGGHGVLDLPFLVPRELAVDAPVEIAITARDLPSSRSVRITLDGVVRKPKICVAGKLTTAQYRAKLAELRSAVAAGDLTQAQFDRYDAELVTCLK